MKQQIGWFFFVLLLSSFLASARLLQPPKGPRQEKEAEVNDNTISQSSFELEDNMEELMGSEECYVKDEGCRSRRMIVDVHLDYIYTQHHKP